MAHQAGFWLFVLVASGLFGLLIGSFLNVVIYRVPRGMSIVQPPSHCPTCGTELRPWDNLPVLSWLLLHGRCRYCRAPISIRYPLVEAATGAAFVAIAWTVPTFWALPSLFLVAACTIAAAGIDVDALAVPWAIAVGAGLGAAALAVVAAAAHQQGRIGWAAVGLVAAVTAALVVRRDSEERHRAATVASLGWTAGWLWPPAGGILALWTLVTAFAIVIGPRADHRVESGGNRAAWVLARVALWGGGIVVVLAAAAVSPAG